MKFLHVADLHIGKVVNEFSMIEDQKIILNQILQTAIEQRVEAIILAGDIYDRAVPPSEAVAVFDHFLTSAVHEKIPIVMIAGNHDSQERIGFLKEPLGQQGIYIAGKPEEELIRVCFPGKEEAKPTEVVLFPFGKPAQQMCRTSNELVEKVLSHYWEQEKEQAKQEKNRILVTHFFVTDQGKLPELSDSETTLYVGSLDDVETSLLEGFDYVALGHLHKKQRVGKRPVYYSGAPLKYSFGEASGEKYMLLVTLEDGLKQVEELPLVPLHDMRKIKGTLQELLDQGRSPDAAREDYIQACLFDEGELIDPMETLRGVYPNLMQIVRCGQEEIQTEFELDGISGRRQLVQRQDAESLFAEFYREIKEEELSLEQQSLIQSVIREAKEKNG